MSHHGSQLDAPPAARRIVTTSILVLSALCVAVLALGDWPFEGRGGSAPSSDARARAAPPPPPAPSVAPVAQAPAGTAAPDKTQGAPAVAIVPEELQMFVEASRTPCGPTVDTHTPGFRRRPVEGHGSGLDREAAVIEIDCRASDVPRLSRSIRPERRPAACQQQLDQDRGRGLPRSTFDSTAADMRPVSVPRSGRAGFEHA